MVDVIRGLRYLSRQSIALQGRKGEDNLMQLMVVFGTKKINENRQDHLNKSLGNKYTCYDSQNEHLEIIAHPVLSKKNVFFYNWRRVH